MVVLSPRASANVKCGLTWFAASSCSLRARVHCACSTVSGQSVVNSELSSKEWAASSWLRALSWPLLNVHACDCFWNIWRKLLRHKHRTCSPLYSLNLVCESNFSEQQQQHGHVESLMGPPPCCIFSRFYAHKIHSPVFSIVLQANKLAGPKASRRLIELTSRFNFVTYEKQFDCTIKRSTSIRLHHGLVSDRYKMRALSVLCLLL